MNNQPSLRNGANSVPGLYVDYKHGSIVMTKKFEKAVSKFGSAEYDALQKARHDNQGFSLVVKASPAKTSQFKGLSFEYMEKYIQAHDDENKTNMKNFLDLCGKSKEAKENQAGAASYNDIKDWFLGTYPAIAEFKRKRAEAIDTARRAQ